MTNRYTHVPVTDVGGHRVPALILGDNGFNQKFGSSLTDTDVLDRMTFVLKRSNLGLAAGDSRLLGLARRAEAVADRPATLMFHTDLPLADESGRLRYVRCGASLSVALHRRNIDTRKDPILCYLDSFDTDDALSPQELDRVSIDMAALSSLVESIDRFRPDVVTIGGDWLDMLLLAGKEELALRGIDLLVSASAAHGALVAVTLYVGALVNFRVPAGVGSLLVPYNSAGISMLPDRRAAIAWADGTDLPLLAMHVLGGGRLPLDAALSGAGGARVISSIVGASRLTNIEKLLAAAEVAWGLA